MLLEDEFTKREIEFPYKATCADKCQAVRFATKEEAMAFFHSYPTTCMISSYVGRRYKIHAYKYLYKPKPFAQ